MSAKLARTAKWIAINGLFSFTAWKGVNGNQNAATVFVWLLWIFVVLSFIGSTSKELAQKIKKNGLPVPVIVDVLYDLIMISCLAWFGWYWSAVGMFLIMSASYQMHEKEAV